MNWSLVLILFLASVAVIAVSAGAMAIGVMLGRKPIAGSCGGLANRPGGEHSPCSLCTRPVSECPRRSEEMQTALGSNEHDHEHDHADKSEQRHRT
jgi:uncharacterized protein